MGKKNIDDLKQEDRLKKNTIPNNNINNNNVTLINRVIFGTTSKIDISSNLVSSGVGGYGLNII